MKSANDGRSQGTRPPRRWIVGAALGCFGTAAATAACGSQTGTSGGSVGAAADAPAKLTYLHQWGPNGWHGPATEEMVRRFQAEVPQIEVESARRVAPRRQRSRRRLAAPPPPRQPWLRSGRASWHDVQLGDAPGERGVQTLR